MTAPAGPVLVRLANLGMPRRPAGARDLMVEEVLPEATTAAQQLSGLFDGVIREADLPDLREICRFARDFACWVVDGSPAPDSTRINALAKGNQGYPQLDHDAQSGWRSQITWLSTGPAADLARILIVELGDLDLERLKVCTRAECALVFYDRTRSRTQRWHAENPCGWRARQARHRTG